MSTFYSSIIGKPPSAAILGRQGISVKEVISGRNWRPWGGVWSDIWTNMAPQATGGHKGVLVQAYSKDGVFLET